MAVLDFTTLAKERIGLVEQQDSPAFVGRIEYSSQVLLGLADVLTNNLAQVYPIEVKV